MGRPDDVACGVDHFSGCAEVIEVAANLGVHACALSRFGYGLVDTGQRAKVAGFEQLGAACSSIVSCSSVAPS
ncbi:MAG: hypothetical protein ACU836_14405 [Gammaproteobacteria bacterium]